MQNINLLQTIGNTPLVTINKAINSTSCNIFAKAEYFNPSGSIKDRIALHMIEEAEKAGFINKNTVIIEPTSGNTGIAFSMVCAIKGYKMIAVMPEAVSFERRKLIEQFGAKTEIVKCINKEKGVTKEDMEGVVNRAIELNKQYSNSFIPNQFTNPNNPKAHSLTTAQEILRQTDKKIDAFVAACGTGGTFSGIARTLKDFSSAIKCIVVEPASSPVLSGGQPGFHRIEGIGEGFIPAVMDLSLADEIIQVTDADAIVTAKLLWQQAGLAVGISSGANIFAALQVARDLPKDSNIVTILADSGLRYFSTQLFG